MKKERGFTLVELLAVVVLIGLISTISVPIVKNIVKDSKQKGYEKQINVILESAKNWATLNTDILPDSGSIIVKMETLKQEGLLENKKIINPVNDEEINACVKITYNEDYNQYEYSFDEECISPDSLRALATTSPEVTSVPACLIDGTTCVPGTPVAIKVNASEVYNFYVISDEENEVTLIMDRNLYSSSDENYGNVAWSLEEDYGCGDIGSYCAENNKGPITAIRILKQRTSLWTNIPERVYTYSDDGGGNMYPSLSEIVRARMLTYTEANSIKVANNDIMPNWLHINLRGAGDDYTQGYWLSSAYVNDFFTAHFISFGGSIDNDLVSETSCYGLRPVITLTK